jgi:hypothetical protein
MLSVPPCFCSTKTRESCSVVKNVLDFRVNAVAEVASVSAAGAQKLARFFGYLGLNAPLLDARYDQIGVE